MTENTPPVTDIPKSPEKLPPIPALVGLQARLLLTGPALNPDNKTVPPVSKEQISPFETRDYSSYHKASIQERREYWKTHQPDSTFQEQYENWVTSNTALFTDNKTAPILDKLTGFSTSIGIDFKHFTPAEADKLFKRYFASSSPVDKDGVPSNIKLFVHDVLTAYIKDNKLDLLKLKEDLPTFQWLGNLFGETGSELVAQLIDAESKQLLEGEQTKLLTEANEEERINKLVPDEERILRYVWDGAAAEPPQPPKPPEPGPKPGEDTDGSQPKTGVVVGYERMGESRIYPNEELLRNIQNPDWIAHLIKESDPGRHGSVDTSLISQRVHAEEQTFHRWMERIGLNNDALEKIIVDNLASYTSFLKKEYGVDIPDIKHARVIPLVGIKRSALCPKDAFAFVSAEMPAIFINFDKIINYAEDMTLDKYPVLTRDALQENIVRLLHEVNPHEYTHLTSDIAYWYTKKDVTSPEKADIIPGKVGIKVAKPVEIDSEGKITKAKERGRGLMEAVTVQLTAEWLGSMNSPLKIPAYNAERMVLHAICNKIAQEDGVTPDDVFKYFVNGYYTPEGFREMAEKLSGKTVDETTKKIHFKRHDYLPIIYALMQYEAVVASHGKTHPDYKLTIGYVNGSLSSDQKQILSQLINDKDTTEALQLSPSAIKTLALAIGVEPPKPKTEPPPKSDTPPPPKDETPPDQSEITVKEFPTDEVQMVGNQGDGLKLVFAPKVLEKANKDLLHRSYRRNGRLGIVGKIQFSEQGGFFVGKRYKTHDGQLWTEIVDYFPAKHTQGNTAGAITFTPSTFADINAIVDMLNISDHENYITVGWAHTHPQGFAGMMTENYDDTVNQAAFSADGQFAYVFGAGDKRDVATVVPQVMNDTYAFFSQKGGTDKKFGSFTKHAGYYVKKDPTVKPTGTPGH